MEPVVSIPNKTQITNSNSKLLLIVNGPGLDSVHYASGRLVRGEKPQARLALLTDDGELIHAKRTSCEWKPYVIQSEFEFPNGLIITQRSWVDAPFAHASITFRGTLSGARLVADGVSYDAAKILVSPQQVVLLEEITPAYKPFVLQIASSVTPSKVMLSSDGETWSDNDFIWGERPVHYRMIFDKLPRELALSAHLGKLSNYLTHREWEHARGRERAVKREWERALEDEYPDIDCKDQRYRDVIQFSFYVHRSGIFKLDGMLPYPFVAASKVTYPMWWLWDSAFHSITDAWMDRSVAQGDLLNHTIMQSGKGCIQDAGGEFYADTGELKWVHPEQYDDYPPPCTGPCVNGIATWDVYQKTGDLDFLKKMYPHLVMYERWLMEEKPGKIDPDLIAYYNWCDVGWDDSKRWGRSGMEDRRDVDISWDLPVVPVDGNVYLLLLRDTLSKTAGLLGDADKRREYAEKAARTRRAIDRLMWNEEAGFYFDILPNGEKLKVWSPAGFTPMLAGIPGVDTYQRLREHLLDPKKFWTKYPVPTLSADDEHFSVTNWWRGGTWPVINWTVTEGLFKYDAELGLRLLDATVDVMTKDGHPTCREYYNPHQGQGGGAVDQGWATMPVDLILRRLYGLNPHPDGLVLDPHLPEGWNDSYVRNVFAAGTTVELRYLKSGSSLKAVIKNKGRKTLAVTARDKQISLAPGVENTVEM